MKSVKFRDYTYIGDPINAVRIFNEKKADELLFLDIEATSEKRWPSIELVTALAEECLMPFAVGGGIDRLQIIHDILSAGAEKVSINTHAYQNPTLVKEAASRFGSQSILVSIDVKANLMGKQTVFVESGTRNTRLRPVEYAQRMADLGAGELLVNSIDRDGTMKGYDVALIREVADAVSIPVVAVGGAGGIADLREAVDLGHASAISAGSLFVYHGPRRGVLISFPTRDELANTFAQSPPDQSHDSRAA